ncbi:hypothetical protein DSO57_1034077 [Entomophthora muscae]|uniref:Uncharacterized protein n=1 Tax=Entomophthora muscae TaxID=34485 RepID=A0ACC2UKQ6_9FUNG|nr:hypothetical protein DSO57_1034077 [Entomophthora muscae]
MLKLRETNHKNLILKAHQMQDRDHTKYKLPQFQVEQHVLLFKSSLQNSKSKKFLHKWSGHFVVSKVAPNYNYFLQDMDTKQLPNVVNSTRLKEYRGFV